MAAGSRGPSSAAGLAYLGCFFLAPAVPTVLDPSLSHPADSSFASGVMPDFAIAVFFCSRRLCTSTEPPTAGVKVPKSFRGAERIADKGTEGSSSCCPYRQVAGAPRSPAERLLPRSGELLPSSPTLLLQRESCGEPFRVLADPAFRPVAQGVGTVGEKTCLFLFSRTLRATGPASPYTPTEICRRPEPNLADRVSFFFLRSG